jgi:hypothetical protein
MGGELMRLIGLVVMMAIALTATEVSALAREDRAAEKAASQAQDAVQDTEQAVDQFLYEAQNAGQNGPKSTVLAKEKGKATEKEERTSKVIIPESGGISIGNVALLTIGVSSLVIGVWLFARRATRYVSLPQVPVVAARSLLLSGSR